MINAIAEFERDLLIERTQAGLARAKAEGRALGRPSSLSTEEKAELLELARKGETVSSLARPYKTSLQTVVCTQKADQVVPSS